MFAILAELDILATFTSTFKERILCFDALELRGECVVRLSFFLAKLALTHRTSKKNQREFYLRMIAFFFSYF